MQLYSLMEAMVYATPEASQLMAHSYNFCGSLNQLHMGSYQWACFCQHPATDLASDQTETKLNG